LSAYYGLWVGHIIRGEARRALMVGNSMLSDFESAAGSQDYSLIQRAIGMARQSIGEFETSRKHLEQSIAAYAEERDRSSYLRFGVDTGVASKCFLAITLWPLGNVTAARIVSEDAIELARRINHIPTFAYAHAVIAVLHMMREDPHSSRLQSRAALELSREHGMALYEAWSTMSLGWARWREGRELAGIEEMRSGIQLMLGQGRYSFVQFAQAFLAQAEAATGNFEAAL